MGRACRVEAGPVARLEDRRGPGPARPRLCEPLRRGSDLRGDDRGGPRGVRVPWGCASTSRVTSACRAPDRWCWPATTSASWTSCWSGWPRGAAAATCGSWPGTRCGATRCVGARDGRHGHVPVDRAAPAAAYLHARALLREGEAVGVFPEAGVSTSFTVRGLLPGAVALARETGAPLLADGHLGAAADRRPPHRPGPPPRAAGLDRVGRAVRRRRGRRRAPGEVRRLGSALQRDARRAPGPSGAPAAPRRAPLVAPGAPRGDGADPGAGPRSSSAPCTRRAVGRPSWRPAWGGR